MSSINIDDISQVSSVDTFAPVAVYRLKYYQPETLFDNVLYALIRPPRFVYNQRLLIPGRKYQQRFDYQVHNIPFPLSIYWAQNPKYIILYLHGNSSSRFQGYLHLKQLPQGACLACFDFKGCGLRKDGKYITLGKQQSLEVDIAVQYLKTYGYPIVGWGRSMGAVSLLMSSKCQIMIADSPFASLYSLCKQTSLNFAPTALCCLVHCLFPCIFCCVRSGVQKKSGMDPNQLEIIRAVQNQSSTKCLLIMAGKQDSMIHYSHAERLHDAFKGKSKRLILFEGTHNSNRPQQVLDQCFEFIDSCIQSRSSSNQQKVIKPVDRKCDFKVLKIDRQSSKQSLIVNHPTVHLSDNRDFESSKQNLIMNLKCPIQLKQLKIAPSKSSPKKLSKIQGDIEFTQQANIEINQQEDIIRQGIGKFEKNLHIQNGKMTFKQISKKNQIQNSSSLRSSHRESSNKPNQQINMIKCGITKQSNLNCLSLKGPKSNFVDQSQRVMLGPLKSPARIEKNNKGVQIELNKSKRQTQQTPLQSNLCEFYQQIRETPIDEKKTQIIGQFPNQSQRQSEMRIQCQQQINITQTRQISTPMSHPSSLFYDDVKLLQEDMSTIKNQSHKQLLKKQQFTKQQIGLDSSNKDYNSPSKKKIQNDKYMTPKIGPMNPIIQNSFTNKISVDNLTMITNKNEKMKQLQQIESKKSIQGKNSSQVFPHQLNQIQFIDL